MEYNSAPKITVRSKLNYKKLFKVIIYNNNLF